MEDVFDFHEVEDIMCDQVIISTELDVDFNSKRSTVQLSATRIKLAVTILADALLPTVLNLYYAYIRSQQTVVENVSRRLIPTIIAVLANYISKSLSSVQRGIAYPLMLRQIKSANEGEGEGEQPDDTGEPEKCVECCVLSEPETSPIRADVIFIHGLHGSLKKTWRQGDWRHEKHKIRKQKLGKSLSTGDIRIRKRSVAQFEDCSPSKQPRVEIRLKDHLMDIDEEEEKYSPCWPQEWLPRDCPGVRVISIEYTTDPHLWRPIWVKKRNRTSMPERSKEMIDELLNLNVGENPIIWVSHSKGGLFVKQIIVDCYNNRHKDDRLERMYKRTKGILFYSVPHRGSVMADFNLPLMRKSIEVTEVERNCQFVLNLHEKFLKLFEDADFNPEVFSFIETSFTLLSFVYLKIIAYDSADPGVGHICPVPLDHREICKPAGRDCFLYKELVSLINGVTS